MKETAELTPERTFGTKASVPSDIRKVSDMLKILLLVGGVWFSLALLFVSALFAAHSKSFPKRDSELALKGKPHAPRPVVHAASDRAVARRPADWELEKPVEA